MLPYQLEYPGEEHHIVGWSLTFIFDPPCLGDTYSMMCCLSKDCATVTLHSVQLTRNLFLFRNVSPSLVACFLYTFSPHFPRIKICVQTMVLVSLRFLPVPLYKTLPPSPTMHHGPTHDSSLISCRFWCKRSGSSPLCRPFQSMMVLLSSADHITY